MNYIKPCCSQHSQNTYTPDKHSLCHARNRVWILPPTNHSITQHEGSGKWVTVNHMETPEQVGLEAIPGLQGKICFSHRRWTWHFLYYITQNESAFLLLVSYSVHTVSTHTTYYEMLTRSSHIQCTFASFFSSNEIFHICYRKTCNLPPRDKLAFLQGSLLSFP